MSIPAQKRVVGAADQDHLDPVIGDELRQTGTCALDERRRERVSTLRAIEDDLASRAVALGVGLAPRRRVDGHRVTAELAR